MQGAQILDIKKDLEFVENQIQYLDKFLLKINRLFDQYKSGKWWSGPAEQHDLYIETERWLRSYGKLEDHIKRKLIADEEIQGIIEKIPALSFSRPKTSKEEKFAGMKSFLYYVFVPYRITFNKKKLKEINLQIVNFRTALTLLRKAAFKIEAYYMDGV